VIVTLRVHVPPFGQVADALPARELFAGITTATSSMDTVRMESLSFNRYLLQEDRAAVLVQQNRDQAPRVAVGLPKEPHPPLP
jgi:hypothetical protein